MNDIYEFRLTYKEVMNILFCIGFTKQISSNDDALIISLWTLLTQNKNYEAVAARSLYNFLLYL